MTRSVREAQFSTEPVREIGPHTYPPTLFLVEKFQSHLHATKQPETFLGVSLEKPNTSMDYEILSEFHVGQQQRPNSDLIPCSNCSVGEPKFLHGIAILMEDGFIYLVGHCCASKDFGHDRHKKVLQAHSDKVKDERVEEFLFKNITKVRAMTESIKKLLPIIRACRKQHSKMKSKQPILYKELRRLTKENAGRLSVSVKTTGGAGGMRSSSGETSNWIDVVVSQMQGTSILQSAFNIDSKLRIHLRAFEALPFIELYTDDMDDDTILNLMIQINETQTERTTLYETMLTTSRDLKKAVSMISDFHLFYGDDNCLAVSKWGEHPDNEIEVLMTRKGVRCSINSGHEEDVHIYLDGQTKAASMDIPALN